MPAPDFSKMKLRDQNDSLIHKGATVTSYKGEKATVVSYKTPKNSKDLGSVTVKWLIGKPEFPAEDPVEYRPGMFNLMWSIDR